MQGTISVGVDATDLFDRYDEDFEEMPGGGFPHIEINKMHISQSIEVQQNTHTQYSLYILNKTTFSNTVPNFNTCLLHFICSI